MRNLWVSGKFGLFPEYSRTLRKNVAKIMVVMSVSVATKLVVMSISVKNPVFDKFVVYVFRRLTAIFRKRSGGVPSPWTPPKKRPSARQQKQRN